VIFVLRIDNDGTGANHILGRKPVLHKTENVYFQVEPDGQRGGPVQRQ